MAGLAAKGLALGLVTLLALAGVLFRWDRFCQTGPGALAALALVVLGRFALLHADAADALLPRNLGGPGLFGTLAAGGLLFSPADLLLTGLAVYLVAVVARILLLRLAERQPNTAIAASTALALLLAGFAIVVCVPLVRDSQTPLLDRSAMLQGDPRIVLLAGLVLFMLGAAELWGLSFSILRTRHGRQPRLRRLSVALAALLLAFAVSFVLQSLERHADLE